MRLLSHPARWLLLGLVTALAAVLAWLTLSHRTLEVNVNAAELAPPGYEVVAREDVPIRDPSRREMAFVVLASEEEGKGEAEAAGEVVEHLRRQGRRLEPPLRREPQEWSVAAGEQPGSGYYLRVGLWRPFVAAERERAWGEYAEAIERLAPRLAQERRALVLVTVTPPWRDLPLSW